MHPATSCWWPLLEKRKQPCGWTQHLNDCGRQNEAGFTLLETGIALIAAVLLLAACSQWLGNLLLGAKQMLARSETQAMWSNAQRMLTADVHDSSTASIVWGQLLLTTPAGQQLRYVVNTNGELVRIGLEGGSAVVSTSVATMSATETAGVVSISLIFRDGEQEEMTACTLAAIAHAPSLPT